MAAARAVVGPRSFRWSNTRLLTHLGWLNVKQQYMASLLTLTHKIVTTGKPVNIYRSIASPYPYNTRRVTDQELRAWVGTVRARDRTSVTLQTFKYQSILHYDQIPNGYSTFDQNRFRTAAKAWSKQNVT